MVNVRIIRPARSVALALAALLAALAVGCAKPTPTLRPLKIRMAVLDFAPPDESYGAEDFEPKGREGWWLGGKDVYRSQNIGVQASDVIARRLNRAENLTIEPRYDLRYYMADKAELLRAEYPNLTNAQIDHLVIETVSENAVDVGRELQVDRVLTGRVLSERMTHHRTFHTWKSEIEIEVTLWNVNQGDKVFTKVFEETRRFSSPQLALESLADEFADWFADNYGYR